MAWMEKLMMQVALVDQVTKPLAGINAQMDKVTKSGRQGWSNMAMGATTVAGGVMAIQGALGPAIEMDRALAEVASLDVQKEVLGALGREALKLSIQYGESATEIVRSSYDIQSAIAGLEGNELPAFTRASTTLAKATKADTATITNYMGTMYGIFEQQAKQMGKANWVEDVAGKTALAVQLFKTTGQGMADAFGAIGANATAAGISMDEQFAVLGQLQATMSGGEAGTKFKAFLAGVGGAQKALGLQFTDAAGNMLPVLTIMDKLKAKYGETMSVAEGDELKKAFGSDEAVAMIKLLMTNTKGLATNINALANTHGMGKAEQMAAAMTDQWERVTQAWFAIRAAAFGVVLPAINAVVGVFADGATTVLRWTHLFPNLTKVVSYALLAIVGLSMVTGTWMLVAGVAKLATLGLGIAWSVIMAPLNLLKAGLVAFRAIMLAVNIAMYANPIGLIIAGIVLLIGTVAAVIYYWDDLKQTLADWGVFDALQAMIDGAAAGWASFMQLLADLSPFQLLGKAVDWLTDKLNMIPGVNIELGSMPDLTMPTIAPLTMPVMPGVMNMPTQEQQRETVNAPLARYRQQDQSKVPSGGLGQQLIQANAAANTANQKPAKSLHIGEVHITNQNPMTPEQLAENAWLETP
ncbi:phage tail tape measure protein [Aeromonas hydrophila]|uniref:phage tail tape measure protein n=1 Tax=Aeromonas hydrophila TaxID=644 RepID=UPI00165599DD|nr:phage tail tape measure protein [Aeromonas hydrophila]MBC8670868.1 phage tail tape measure protein [Aeromonas hydrophila]MBC8690841.1 phage tail tape measure protein [Aeromonas hydrophila]HAU4888778.1 phage tail tape measure protein [Aeromonas hydrophila]